MPAFYEIKKYDFFSRREKKPLDFPAHLHYHIELALIKSGKTQFTVDSRIYNATGGDIIIAFPNQVHAIKTIETEDSVLMLINPDIIPEFTKQLTTMVPASNVIVGGANDEELSDLTQRLLEADSSDGPYAETVKRGYLLVFFSKLLEKLPIVEADRKEYDALGAIINYCSLNFEKPLSLSLLEKELHISKYYISHTISSNLHVGFNDYVNSLRISRACKYLRRSDMSITQISDTVGFNTLRTFNRAFIKHMGTTPREYRLQQTRKK